MSAVHKLNAVVRFNVLPSGGLYENPVVKAVSNICLGNPRSVVGNNYKNAMAHVSPILNEHENEKREVNLLKELINIRDGHVTCDILSKQEVSDIIVYLCTK